MFHLPYTHFHCMTDHPMARSLWGRVPCEGVAAYLFFHKGSNVQHLMHRLKYKGQYQVGTYLGRQYGQILIHQPPFNTARLIVPVPLHPKRQRERGYNQSEMFANGLGEAMSIPTSHQNLIRNTDSETQTRKSSSARWDNVKQIFSVVNPEEFEGKHLLLVDDVFTTGATIEASATALLTAGNVKISIVTIAYAE
jgi:ComF family protein